MKKTKEYTHVYKSHSFTIRKPRNDQRWSYRILFKNTPHELQKGFFEYQEAVIAAKKRIDEVLAISASAV